MWELWSDETRVEKKDQTNPPHKQKRYRIKNSQERESTLTAIHPCHRRRIPFGHVVIERRCAFKHCKKKGATKKDQPTTQTTKKVPFQTHKIKITKRVRIVIRWNSNSRIVVYSKYITVEGVAMERERVHLLAYIDVTAPVFHFDTSWLNFFAPRNTAREDATKNRKDQPTTNNKKEYRFKNTKSKLIKRVRIVIRWNSSQRINSKYSTEEGMVSKREGVHLLHLIDVTAPVFHLDTSWLNAAASRNTARGCNKERKRSTHHKQRYRFKNTKQK